MKSDKTCFLLSFCTLRHVLRNGIAHVYGWIRGLSTQVLLLCNFRRIASPHTGVFRVCSTGMLAGILPLLLLLLLLLSQLPGNHISHLGLDVHALYAILLSEHLLLLLLLSLQQGLLAGFSTLLREEGGVH